MEDIQLTSNLDFDPPNKYCFSVQLELKVQLNGAEWCIVESCMLMDLLIIFMHTIGTIHNGIPTVFTYNSLYATIV